MENIFIGGFIVGAFFNMLTDWLLSLMDKKKRFKYKKHIIESIKLSKDCLIKYQNTDYVAKYYWLGHLDNSALLAKEIGILEGEFPQSILDRYKDWQEVPKDSNS